LLSLTPMKTKYWYHSFLALPGSKNTTAYMRLSRLFQDPTWLTGTKGTEGRSHALGREGTEWVLTYTLWENFAVYDPNLWVPELIRQAGLVDPEFSHLTATWSYEFESEYAYAGKTVRPIADIVLFFKSGGNKKVVVIEAKRPNNRIEPDKKDADPLYYLSNPEIRKVDPFPAITYCVDNRDLEHTKGILSGHDLKERIGFITWQGIHALQLQCAAKLETSEEIREAVTMALEQQACDLKIIRSLSFQRELIIQRLNEILQSPNSADIPSALRCFLHGALYYNEFRSNGLVQPVFPEYLSSEPSFEALDRPDWKKQSTAERREAIWNPDNQR
jgi:hypothetical protein